MEEQVKQEIEQIKCLNCGTTLQVEQEFCPKCGIRRGERKVILCAKCNSEIQIGQKFCPKCGERIKLENKTVISSVKNKYQRKLKGINKKKLGIIVGTIGILIILAFAFTKISPKIFISIDDLLAQGKYEEAYKKAKNEEKENVYYENAIAYVSSEIIESYKDPSSFELREAWVDKAEKRIVLKTAGKNSFGGITFSYQYITYDKDDNKYEVYCSLSDLDEEKTYSFDNTSDKIEKILKNAARKTVKEIIQKDSCKVSSKIIDNINRLAAQKLLDTVIPLEEIGETEKI